MRKFCKSERIRQTIPENDSEGKVAAVKQTTRHTEWEGVIEECKRELRDLSIKTAEDVGWRFGRPYCIHHSDEPGITRRAAMRTGRGGKHLFSSSDKDSGDSENDEPPKEKQLVDVWLPSTPPNFLDHVWGPLR